MNKIDNNKTEDNKIENDKIRPFKENEYGYIINKSINYYKKWKGFNDLKEKLK